jgi:hypothetical protein
LKKGGFDVMKEIISDIITVLIFMALLWGAGYFIEKYYEYQANECIKNNGTVVTNSVGRFEKCIYGG